MEAGAEPAAAADSILDSARFGATSLPLDIPLVGYRRLEVCKIEGKTGDGRKILRLVLMNVGVRDAIRRGSRIKVLI